MPPAPPLTLAALAAVAGGGAIGSVLRYAIGVALQDVSKRSGLPYGTIAVNVAGAFLLGWLLARLSTAAGADIPDNVRLFLAVGVLGGFTTFSAFSGEIFTMLQGDQVIRALSYAAVSVVGSVTATTLGFVIARGAA
jgi:CrcB protein